MLASQEVIVHLLSFPAVSQHCRYLDFESRWFGCREGFFRAERLPDIRSMHERWSEEVFIQQARGLDPIQIGATTQTALRRTRSPSNRNPTHQLAIGSIATTIPQEVLLAIVYQLDDVSTAARSIVRVASLSAAVVNTRSC